jgi:[protein-PII] uridylyltransferase
MSTTLVPELKRYLSHHRAAVEEMIATGDAESGATASRRYAKVMDGLITSLFHAARGVMVQKGQWRPVALAGVGSYGRTSLSVFSDLDVRLLCEGDPEGVQQIAEALLYPLWDAGLNIGHQVVTFDEGLELARRDLPTATSLLDWRHLEGEVGFTERFQHRAFEEVFNLERLGGFIEELSKIAYERKERFGGSVFLLEPELKSGAGGLRDVDLMHWASRARWRVKGLSDLVRLGVLLPDEWTELDEAIRFLMRVRNSLHHRTRKRIDRLGFNDQEHLAERFGYGSDGAAVEAFMSDYYRHARQIERTSEMVLRRAVPPSKHKPVETSIGGGLKLVGAESVALEDEDAIYSEPELVFRMYEEAVARTVRVNSASRRAVMRALSTPDYRAQLRADPECSAVFRSLVCTPKETVFKHGSILNELHEVGLLVAMIPEFAPVVGRVHHDVYHVYTVDVHSVAALDKMRALFRGDLRSSQGLATLVAGEFSKLEVLFFATLLHDVGKDAGGKDHAERGAVLAQGILSRLGFEQEEIHRVQHLIRKHLKMYLIATRRDIDDPRTLESFTDEVVNPQGLRELYLLTIADVSTTSPNALSTWKQRMLDELFQATDRWLMTGETRLGATRAVAAEVRELLPADVPTSFAEAFLTSMPARYLSANRSEQIVDHIKLALEADQDDSLLTIVRRSDPHVEIAVVMDDRPGVLARICATLSRHMLKVVSAQVYSWRDERGCRRALDLLWVRSGQDPQLVVEALPRLNKTLRELARGEGNMLEMVAGRKDQSKWSQRPSPAVPIQVRIDNRGASSHTILEVITKDRADVLFWISEAIFEMGLSIELAKIHSEGVRVTDVFYICTEDGKKIEDEAKLDALKEKIKGTLVTLEESNKS